LHEELLRKLEITSGNKSNLENVIQELDQEKNKDIKKTVKEVDKNLHDIFSVLLPGTSAALRSVFVKAKKEVVEEGEMEEIVQSDLLTGLELKVSFNGVEKESLSELSGGQKSLLALSLILALLKYQPAPLYILDEIDSALDLSHTQNIGDMIRKYFKSS